MNKVSLYKKLTSDQQVLFSLQLGIILFEYSQAYWRKTHIEAIDIIDQQIMSIKTKFLKNGKHLIEKKIKLDFLNKYDDQTKESIIAMDCIGIITTIQEKIEHSSNDLTDCLIIYMDSVDYYIQEEMNISVYDVDTENNILNHQINLLNNRYVSRLYNYISSLTSINEIIFDELNRNFRFNPFNYKNDQ